MDEPEPIPFVVPSYADRVRRLIKELERRAADGEVYARLVLPGWRKELEKVERGEYL